MSTDVKKTYDVCIIGGGASGLLCGILIKKFNKNLSVAIFESSERVGKKLLVTGNGRCNITNLNLSPQMYHGSFKYCGKHLLTACPPEQVISIFKDLGLFTKAEANGMVYPLSKQANSVLDVLRQNLKDIEIFTDSKVIDINKTKGSYTLKTDECCFKTDILVVASGGKASPNTGANADILNVLSKLGHTISPLTPSLCPIRVSSPHLKSLKGLRVTAKVSILQNNKVLKSQEGELQFADNALSGICVFNLSGIANSIKDTEISVSLLNEYKEDEIFSFLKNKIQILGDDVLSEELLIGVFSKMIGFALLKESGISPNCKIKLINDKNLKNLCKTINDWRFKVIPHDDFTRSQVTAGGVIGKEIDMYTMESKLFKNLYVLGEATDCDGDCGGANLQYAFASAYVSAKDITK